MLEIASGMVPLAGAVQRLADIVGPKLAARLVMLSEPLSARKALELNIISELVPDDDLERRAVEVASALSIGPTCGYAVIRRC